MSTVATWQVGEAYFNVDIYSGQDLSSFATFVLKLKDPSGNTSSLTASRVDNDTAGVADDIVRYTMASGVLDEEGVWTYWAHVSGGTGVGPWISEPYERMVRTEGEA